MIRIACCFVLAAVLSTSAQADDALVTKSYEIGVIVEPALEPDTGHVGLPFDPPQEVGEPWEEDVRQLSPAALVDWIQAAVQPEIWNANDDVGIERIGNRLFVTAPAKTQAAVEAFLTRRWNEAAVRVRVDVDWLRFDPASRAGLREEGLLAKARAGGLSPAERGRLLAAARAHGRLLSSASGLFRPGTHVGIRNTTENAYIRDYDIEIAQDSTVGNPLIDAAIGGWSFDLRPFVLRGGQVLLETLLLTADVDAPMRRMSLEAPPVGTVDLPRARVRRVGSATTMASGAARAWVFESADDLEVVIIGATVKRPTRAVPPPGAFDLRALLAAPATFRIMNHPDAPSYAHPAVQRVEPSDAARESQILDVLQRRFPDTANEIERPTLEVVERHLFVRGQPRLAGEVGKWLGALEASRFRRRRLGLRLIEKGETAERVLAATSIDVILGRLITVQDGVEHAYVADWDVEVAQEARAGDPITAVLFDGWIVNARADPLPAEGWAVVTLDLTWTSVDTPFEIRRPRNECTGVIEVPRISTAAIARQLSLKTGTVKVIDVGSRGGTATSRLALEVVLRD